MKYESVLTKVKDIFVPGIIISFFVVSLCGCNNADGVSEPHPETKWTIMYYGDGDCDLESALLEDVAEMKAGIVDGQGVNVIVLFDRISSYSSDSSVFGQNFTDTRLYRITSGKAWRLSGSTQFPEIAKTTSYEANMGDAATLKKFIEFCKANYPADNYSLILSNHGGGSRKKKSSALESGSVSVSVLSKDICYDQTSGNDFLYTAEISDTLTSDESVQLFGLDACLMSSVEFAYQFRNDSGNTGFKADIMVASAPLETGYGWDYEAILHRLQAGGGDNGTPDTTLGGNELYYDPAALTAAELGAIIVEEQRDSTAGDSSQSLTCLDLSKIKAVKTAVDNLAKSLVAGQPSADKTNLETLRGSGTSVSLLHYFNETSLEDWVFLPFFDIHNLATAMFADANFNSLDTETGALITAVDDLVLYSFANSDFSGFTEGQNGVHIFFPDGDAVVVSTSKKHWYYQDWYNAIDISSEYTGAPLGKLAWCIDGRDSGINAVGNWFELLDSWFDFAANGSDGGDNFYQW